MNVWEEFDQLVTDAAIGQWHTCLEAYVEAEGGNFDLALQYDNVQIKKLN